jgi:hypothetical protein
MPDHPRNILRRQANNHPVPAKNQALPTSGRFPANATRMKVRTMRQEARIDPRNDPATFELPPARQR